LTSQDSLYRPPRWCRIALVLTLYVALGGIYLFTTPLFETPDEYTHYEYVRFVAENRSLPPLFVSTLEWEQGQLHQPPLYYTLCALLAGGLDSPHWQDAYPRNPYAALGLPESPGNKNAVLRAASPTLESARTTTAVRMLRAFSLVCSAITVWLAHQTALTVFPGRPCLALATAALVAFNPQFLFISASVNNDVLVTALASAVLLLAVRVARTGGHAYGTPLAMGALAGLAALSKISGLASLALVPCAYLLHYVADGTQRRERLWPEAIRPTLLASGTAALVAGWWFLRNAIVYNDVLGMAQYTRTFAVHTEPLSLVESLIVMYEAIPSYWGVFGWMNVLAPAPYYEVVTALTIVAALGLSLRVSRAWRRRPRLDDPAVRAGAVAAIWATVMLGLILRWTQTIARTQGRLLFPAAGVLALAMAMGITGWLPRRGRQPALLVLCALLLVAAAAMPWLVIAPAYAAPPRVAVEALPADLPRLNIRFDDEIMLLGAQILTEEAQPDEDVWVRLYWLTETPLTTSFTVALQLVGASGERLGGVDTLPAMGRYPTTAWSPGEVLVDDCALAVAPDAVGPVAADIRVSLYAGSHTDTLEARDAMGNALGGSVSIGRIRLPGVVAWENRAPGRGHSASFGEMLRLHGYDLTALEADSGTGTLALALYWECLARPKASYTVFVHLLDENGERIAQGDAPPLGGAFDTLFWRPGDRVYDRYDIRVPEGSPTQDLTLRVGLYEPLSGARLPVTGSQPARDYVDIGPFAITPGGVAFDAEAQ